MKHEQSYHRTKITLKWIYSWKQKFVHSCIIRCVHWTKKMYSYSTTITEVEIQTNIERSVKKVTNFCSHQKNDSFASISNKYVLFYLLVKKQKKKNKNFFFSISVMVVTLTQSTQDILFRLFFYICGTLRILLIFIHGQIRSTRWFWSTRTNCDGMHPERHNIFIFNLLQMLSVWCHLRLAIFEFWLILLISNCIKLLVSNYMTMHVRYMNLGIHCGVSIHICSVCFLRFSVSDLTICSIQLGGKAIIT